MATPRPRSCWRPGPALVAAVLAIAIAGCGDNEPALTRDRACVEQATTWCDYVRGGSGCFYSYVDPCALPDASALIRQSSQDACLDAMAAVAPELQACDPEAGDCVAAVPAVCRALWSTR